MPDKPTHADAELILKLYDARREAELRKARRWWTTDFWPQSADDIVRVARGADPQENAWYRQTLGYWGIVASFVKHGVLHPDLFYEQSFCGEMFFIYAKVAPFLKEVRQKMQNPLLLANLEALVNTKQGQERFEAVSRNVEIARKARAQQAKAS
jgi:hypothetical protein